MRAPLLLTLALLAAGCTGPGDLGEPDNVSSHTQRLDPESYYNAGFELGSKSRVRVTFEVTSGGAIDVWLASAETCSAWLQPDFAPIARATSAQNGTLTAELPAGSACLILDNADLPPGPTSPTGPVVVEYRIETWRI